MYSKKTQKSNYLLKGVVIGSMAIGAGVLGYQLGGDKEGGNVDESTQVSLKLEQKVSSVAAGQQAVAENITAPEVQLSGHPLGCGCAVHQKLAAQKQQEVQAEKVKPIVLNQALRKNLVQHAKGQMLAIELPGGGVAEGVVEVTMVQDGRQYAVSGTLHSPQKGKFYFSEELLPGKAGLFSGAITYDESDVAYNVVTTAAGEVVLEEENVHGVLCRSYSLPAKVEEQQPEFIAADHPTDVQIPSYQNGIIPLESLPGSLAVVYLDFDGEEGPHMSWGDFDAAAPGLSNTQVKDVWERVAEDFAPFNINVTTDLGVYQAAPANSRIQCIVTPTTDAAPGTGGVAFVGDFNRSLDRPCWSFYTTGKFAAEVIAHEVGHTLGLGHDGRTIPDEGYYSGHGSGDVSWGQSWVPPTQKTLLNGVKVSI